MGLNLPANFTVGPWKQQLEQADKLNVKQQQDILMGKNRLFLTDSAGGTWVITVSTSGVLSAVAGTPLPRPG